MKLKRRKREPVFTGNCPVRPHTADGAYIGRCDHSTHDGRCHLHGDVSRCLGDDADLSHADDRRIFEGGEMPPS